MDKKSKILIWFFGILVAVSVAYAFYRYMIVQDFEIYTDEEVFMESLLEE